MKKNQKNQKKRNNKGFSLVELIVVIAIMAVLMGVLAPTLIGNVEKSRESTDLQNIDTIRGAVVTAMSSEDVHDELMTAAGTSGVTISLGAAATASVDNISGYPDLQRELTATLTSPITMKSTRGKASGNNLVIFVSSTGDVTVQVSDGSGAVVNCSKTKEESGSDKPLRSGSAVTSTGSGAGSGAGSTTP